MNSPFATRHVYRAYVVGPDGGSWSLTSSTLRLMRRQSAGLRNMPVAIVSSSGKGAEDPLYPARRLHLRHLLNALVGNCRSNL